MTTFSSPGRKAPRPDWAKPDTRMKREQEKAQRKEFMRRTNKTMHFFGVSFVCATFINIALNQLASGEFKTERDYEKAIERIEENFKVRIKDRMPRFGEVEFMESAD